MASPSASHQIAELRTAHNAKDRGTRRTWILAANALSTCAAAALLAACAGSRPPIGAPDAMPQSHTLAAHTNNKNYRVVYSFGALPDGNYPAATLIDVGGTLLYAPRPCGRLADRRCGREALGRRGFRKSWLGWYDGTERGSGHTWLAMRSCLRESSR
jgi:hypothetical protein